MNREVNAIISAILDEHRAELEALFDENHLLGEASIMSKWDHGFSEGRVSGFRFERDGYACHFQVILNAEVIRPERPTPIGNDDGPSHRCSIDHPPCPSCELLEEREHEREAGL